MFKFGMGDYNLPTALNERQNRVPVPVAGFALFDAFKTANESLIGFDHLAAATEERGHQSASQPAVLRASGAS
jgi:hypothetical protein